MDNENRNGEQKKVSVKLLMVFYKTKAIKTKNKTTK